MTPQLWRSPRGILATATELAANQEDRSCQRMSRSARGPTNAPATLAESQQPCRVRAVRRSGAFRDGLVGLVTVAAVSNVLPFPSNGRPDVPEPEPLLRTVIGDVLRDERHHQERTLAEVAGEAAVSLPYLSEVERGRKEVSSDVLGAICDALDLPLADVLDRSAERLRIDARAQRGSGFQLLAA